MKATIESTTTTCEMKDLQGRPFACRVWQGVTEGGVPFTAYIPVVMVLREDDQSEFERELTAHTEPSEATWRAIDLRLVT